MYIHKYSRQSHNHNITCMARYRIHRGLIYGISSHIITYRPIHRVFVATSVCQQSGGFAQVFSGTLHKSISTGLLVPEKSESYTRSLGWTKIYLYIYTSIYIYIHMCVRMCININMNINININISTYVPGSQPPPHTPPNGDANTCIYKHQKTNIVFFHPPLSTAPTSSCQEKVGTNLESVSFPSAPAKL